VVALSEKPWKARRHGGRHGGRIYMGRGEAMFMRVGADAPLKIHKNNGFFLKFLHICTIYNTNLCTHKTNASPSNLL